MKRRKPANAIEPSAAMLGVWTNARRRRATAHHWRLIEAAHPRYKTAEDDQALDCPFYVCLPGPLGMDWGVIMNPASPRYGLLTFEHAACECPSHPKRT